MKGIPSGPTLDQLRHEKKQLTDRKKEIIDRIRDLNTALKTRLSWYVAERTTSEREELVAEGIEIDAWLREIAPIITTLAAVPPPRDPDKDALKARNRLLFDIAYTADLFLYAEDDAAEDRHGDHLAELLQKLTQMIPDWNHRDPEVNE